MTASPTDASEAISSEVGETPQSATVAADVGAEPTSSLFATLWHRIHHHKVMHWTLAYAAAAYTLLHGVEMVSGALSWPHGIVRVLTLVLILGVPVVVTIAWYHGAKGLQKISGPELLILTFLGIITGTVLWTMAGSSEHASTATTESADTQSASSVASMATAPRTAVAVLPFANLTGDPSKEYLGDGMAEELINTLTKVPGLRVPARTSTFAYKGRNTDIRQIANDLGVGTILQGSVRSAGTTIRITAQLIDTQTDSHLWSETYDRKFTDLFKLQDDLAKAIVQALQVNLKGAALASVTQAPPTRDLEAYQLYLQGSSLVDRITGQNLNRAIDYFQQAIARDPRFAQAYVGVAFVHLRMAGSLGLQPFEHIAAAERASRQALALDPNSALAQATMAAANDFRAYRLEAEVHSLASLSLGGNDANVRTLRALHLMRGGHLRDALGEGRQAMALAPANPVVVGNLATFYSLNGRDAEALRYGGLAVDLGYAKDSQRMALVYSNGALRAGNYADATEIAIKALDPSDPEQARTAEVIKLVHAALANPIQRTIALAAIRRLYPKPDAARQSAPGLNNVGPCLESSYRYALLGALDSAYGLANQCLDRMAPGAVYSGNAHLNLWAPWLRPFRQDPSFQGLATRMGFMEYWQQYGPPDDCDLKDGKLTCH